MKRVFVSLFDKMSFFEKGSVLCGYFEGKRAEGNGWQKELEGIDGTHGGQGEPVSEMVSTSVAYTQGTLVVLYGRILW